MKQMKDWLRRGELLIVVTTGVIIAIAFIVSRVTD